MPRPDSCRCRAQWLSSKPERQNGLPAAVCCLMNAIDRSVRSLFDLRAYLGREGLDALKRSTRLLLHDPRPLLDQGALGRIDGVCLLGRQTSSIANTSRSSSAPHIEIEDEELRDIFGSVPPKHSF